MPPAETPYFLSAAKIEALAAFRSPDSDVVSLSLAVDGTGVYPAALQQVLRQARERDPRLKTLSRDLDKIERFISSEFSPGPFRGLSIYSCAKRGLWETVALPQPCRSAITIGEALDLKPLKALQDQYHRFGALLIGPKRARFVEIYLGAAAELGEYDGDLSAVDSLGGLATHAAALTRERRFDRLILGGDPALEAALTPLLDPLLQRDLIVEPLLGHDRPVDAVVERVLHNEREARRVRESVLVHRLLDLAKSSGAVTGLESVTAAVQQDCVSRVLVRDGYAKMGRSCPKCGHLSVDHRSCPFCFKPTETVLDLVEELVDRAVEKGCEVFRVMHDARFDGMCRIGAELKVAAPSERRAPPPTDRALRGRFATKDGKPSPLRPR